MSILLFFIILVVLILVHEFGHFIVAKKSGIRVDEFGIGFPPKLWGKKYGETEYTLNALPFGGFVKIHGEDPNEEAVSGADRERSFVNKPKYIQAAVLVAGVFFNLLLAWGLFSFNYMIGTPMVADDEQYGARVRDAGLTVVGVIPGSPAYEAGLQPWDRITMISQGETVRANPTPDEFQEIVSGSGGNEVTVEYSRGEEAGVLAIIPEMGIVEDAFALGISMEMLGMLRLPPHSALWEGLRTTVEATHLTAFALFGFFADIFTGAADFSQVAGPVGIVSLVGDASALGLVYLLSFTAIISINLAIINILPIPALDGGRLLFVLIEAIKGSPIPMRVANFVNATGFALLILLMLLVTYKDIVRLVGG